MIPEMERRLAAFVDRKDEMARFCEMLETRDKPIMVVWGEAGLGKTSLFFRMMHECSQRKLRKADLVWSDTRNHDYVAVMCKIRDNLGADCFQSFSQLVNAPASSQIEVKIDVGVTGEVNVASGMQVDHSKVGDVAAAIIKDSTFVLPMSDRAALERNRMIRLTDEFIRGLGQALQTEPLVIFFDAVEKMSADTSKWVWGELLRAVADGTVGQIVVVLCGREKPQFDRDMEFIVEEAELKPLGEADIFEYLTKRCQDEKVDTVVNEEARLMMATMLFNTTKGKPDEVAYAVEGALKGWKKRASGR